MITVDEAFTAYARELAALAPIEVAADFAAGHVLAGDACSAVDLPPFPQSAMDGYALRAADLERASETNPVTLPIALTVAAAGLDEVPTLAPGTCARIFTGGHVPLGADAVVMQEHVHQRGSDAVFTRTAAVGQNRRERAEEIARGGVVCRAGARLTPGRIGAITAAGVARVTVRPRPRVSVLVTGDEVVALGTALAPGEVYDCNSPMTHAWLAERGITARMIRLPDDPEQSAILVGEALDTSDLVITTGGVSVGERDYVMAAAKANGVRDVFWKVAQKPGKPLFFGVRDGTAMVGLPGNPAAVFVGLVVHIARVLDHLEGVSPAGGALRRGVLAEAMRPARGRDVWFRCRAESDTSGSMRLTSLGGQASHMLSNLSECSALARIPAGEVELAAGSVVDWLAI